MPDEPEGTGIATVVDRPTATQEETVALPEQHDPGTVLDRPPSHPSGPSQVTPVELPAARSVDDVVARLDGEASARGPLAAGTRRPATAPTNIVTPRPATAPTTVDSPEVSMAGLTSTSAADALHFEEIERTRLFIRLGWMISAAAIGVTWLLPSPREMQIAMVIAMALGIFVSFFFHRAFADPRKYTQRALVWLALMCVVNSHVAVLYFGPFTMAPVIMVIGIHFLGRTEAVAAGKWIVGFSLVNYAILAALVVSGAIDDPGVFATDAELTPATEAIGAGFVLGTYLLAFITGRVFRAASLVAIDELARATRVATQREALMTELRADLERALRVGGPGRYSDQTVGAFKLGIVLGRGAMGEVYEAVHVPTGQPAAVKLLRRELRSDATAVARFLREAKASGSLASPYVVRVLDASPDDALLPYLAMERLHGITLAEVLRRESRLPASHVVELVRHAGGGIDAAAAAGIVHRDLKPQNLFQTFDGTWKILDFGVATLADDSGALTQGGVVGTPSYMAPEQAQGRRVDGRADVYALAAVAYRCLTGRHPFSGTDTPAMLYAVVHKMPLRPTCIADLHTDVDACLAVALAKDPEDRFASGGAFAVALASALTGSLDPALRKRAASLLRRHPWEDAS